jgi:uncharacterized RmlC-like cupin family protein
VSDEPEVVAIRTGVGIDSRQKIPYFVGVSEATTGARGLSLQYVIIPPAAASAAYPPRLRDSHIRLVRTCGDNLWARVAQERCQRSG